MIELAWVISILAALYIGYVYERILKSIDDIKQSLKNKVEVKKPIEKKSDILDPYSVEQRAKEEHEALMRKLNS